MYEYVRYILRIFYIIPSFLCTLHRLPMHCTPAAPLPGVISIIQLRAVNRTNNPESIEWFIEDQAFLRSSDSASRPPPSAHFPLASCHSSSVFLCVAGGFLTGGREWAMYKIIRLRESLAICKSFNTLWNTLSTPSPPPPDRRKTVELTSQTGVCLFTPPANDANYGKSAKSRNYFQLFLFVLSGQ